MNIKKLRKEKGMTQVDLALKVGVSVNTIRNWEYKVSEPTPENEKKLREVLEEEVK